MAKKNNVQGLQSPKPQGSDGGQSKTNGFVFGLLAILTAVFIMVAVVGGAFYIVIHNNVNGLADKHRAELQKIPVLNLALPKPPDPEDPKYLTNDQVLSKYQELRKKRDELTKQLEDANKQIDELKKFKDDQDKITAGADGLKKAAEAQTAQAEAQKKQNEDDRKKFNEMIASGDKAGFKAYFEKVDKDTAKKIYSDIMQEQKASDELKKTAQVYESMESAAAAKILGQMGSGKIDMVVDILKNIKKEKAAEIMAAMDPALSAKVTERISKPADGKAQ